MKWRILVLWIYFAFGNCSLKLLRKQLAHRQVFHGETVNFPTVSNQSPCPNIFEYRYDETGRLYGYLEIRSPSANIIEIEVQFCVGNRVNEGAEGSITLPYLNDNQIIDHIQQGRSLSYRINFPAWRGYQPKITNIIVNGNVVCTDQPYSVNLVPILTTISLRHKLQVNQISLQAAQDRPINNQNTFNPEYNKDFGVRNNPTFDVKINSTSSTPGNKYNFNPKGPKVVPQLIFNPEGALTDEELYSRNPFLYGLSTRRPDESKGVSPRSIPSTVPVAQSINDICGRPSVTNSLVLNGQSIPKGAFPWLVAMFVKNDKGGLDYHCTGTLISKKHVITAGHCVKPDAYVMNPEKIVLVMGRLNILGWGATDEERIIGAEQIFVHPNFSSSTADADISVITLKADVAFTTLIRPVCLWADDSDLGLVVGTKGIAVGWGRDENGMKVSSEPKQIQLPIVSQEQCLRSNQAFTDITSERTFCAGDRSGSGPCNGDSGSGFVLLKNGRWYLRGIVSMSLSDPYTRTCDLLNYVVFTDVSKFTKWLLDLIK